jgi:uncharacterized protein (TIGR02996 family)
MDRTEKGLIAAVIAAPDDDAPRLVYADWLMEKNDPRGELIAQQLKNPDEEVLANEPPHDAWASDLNALDVSPFFRRGFIERIGVQHAAWLPKAELMFARHPIDHVAINHAHRLSRQDFARLAASPVVKRRIRKLTIVDTISTEALAMLAKLPLRELRVRNIERDDAKVIAAMHGLDRLAIDAFRPKAAVLNLVVGSAAVHGLRTLSLGTMFDDAKGVAEVVATLIANKKAGPLVELDLHWNKLDRKSLLSLFERFPTLERVNLRHVWMTDATAKALALSKWVPGKLTKLDLGENRDIGALGKKLLTQRLGDRVSFQYEKA